MQPHEALAAIRNASQVQYSQHARQRMNERGVSRADVRWVLNEAKTAVESDDGDNRWVITGQDLDDENLTVVVVVEVLLVGTSRNFVVTVY